MTDGAGTPGAGPGGDRPEGAKPGDERPRVMPPESAPPESAPPESAPPESAAPESAAPEGAAPKGVRAGDAASFGRVDEDGTVYVRTGDSERSVGQVPGVPADEAMAFFTRRYAALELEVSLLATRVASGALSPDDAAGSIKTVRAAVVDAHAVGDLEGLLARLDALQPLLAEQRSVRKAERAKQSAEAREAKEKFVLEAERLAAGNDWRGGVNRFRMLLDQWKLLPRLDRATDDELWHRFSSARTTYTRRRKAQFAAQNEQRESAKTIKERLATEAEALADSTDWGPTTGVYRDLMAQWKEAGPAPRGIDETLWKRFRGAQDTFFAAKQAALSEQDAEFAGNAAAKEQLLDEQSILPVSDITAARAAYRELLERWTAIGKVPRDSIRPLENRLNAIETAIREAEEDRWRRTNPEARARAEETAAKLRAQIEQQEDKAVRAEARGDTRAATQALDSAATYREWLAQAQKAVDDFSG